MAKNKLQRFAQMKTFNNVFEPQKNEFINNQFHLKGNWKKQIFKNNSPLILELGCGKGEYAIGLAQKYPHKNFIGVDIKGSRMWVGAKYAFENKLSNVAFLRTNVDFVDAFFAPSEVDEIWLTFSDPQPKKINKRLTSKPFIKRYKNILPPNGIIHLKTDNTALYLFTLDEIKQNNYQIIDNSKNVYEEDWINFSDEKKENLAIKTHYEQLFVKKGFKIKYCSFKI